MVDAHAHWLEATNESVASYRRMIDAAVVQLSDQELFARPAAGINSIAVILRHLGGNLKSRWTDFLTTDGEKPNRNREGEFLDWEGDRASLLAHFDQGWSCLTSALAQISDDNIATPVFIRGERHTIPQAVTRSVNHLAYHAGQILLVARIVHQGEWKWLTIKPGASQAHNQQTWGTSASRGVGGSK
ncbi:MAG: DUF1572 family protein [Planctomycetaceae bacterium]